MGFWSLGKSPTAWESTFLFAFFRIIFLPHSVIIINNEVYIQLYSNRCNFTNLGIVHHQKESNKQIAPHLMPTFHGNSFNIEEILDLSRLQDNFIWINLRNLTNNRWFAKRCCRRWIFVNTNSWIIIIISPV